MTSFTNGNGVANGHANGHSNGASNGHANGNGDAVKSKDTRKFATRAVHAGFEHDPTTGAVIAPVSIS